MQDPSDVITHLQREVESYRANFEQLKELHEALQQQHDTALARVAAVEEEAVRAPFSLISPQITARDAIESQRRHWIAGLESKEREFEELRRELEVKPREKAMIRVQLAEELEQPQRVKEEEMRGELEEHRRALAELHRDHELLKTQHAQIGLESETVVKELIARHQSTKAELLDKIRTLQTAMQDWSEADRIRGLENRLAEASRREASLVEEISTVRGERERIAQDAGARVEQAQREYEQGKQAVLQSHSTIESLQRRIRHLEVELSSSVHTHDSLAANVSHLQRELQQVTMSADEKVREAEAELSRSKLSHLEFRQKSEKSRQELQLKADSLQDRLDQGRRQINALNRQMEQKDRDLATRERREKDLDSNRLRLAEETIQQLRLQLSECESTKQLAEDHNRSLIAEHEIECDALRAATDSIIAERDAIAEKHRTVSLELDRTTATMRERLGGADTIRAEHQRLQDEADTAKRIADERSTETESLALAVEELQRELTRQQGEGERERLHHAESLTLLRRQQTREEGRLQQREISLVHQVAEMKRRYKDVSDEYRRERKRCSRRYERLLEKYELVKTKLATIDVGQSLIRQEMEIQQHRQTLHAPPVMPEQDNDLSSPLKAVVDRQKQRADELESARQELDAVALHQRQQLVVLHDG